MWRRLVHKAKTPIREAREAQCSFISLFFFLVLSVLFWFICAGDKEGRREALKSLGKMLKVLCLFIWAPIRFHSLGFVCSREERWWS